MGKLVILRGLPGSGKSTRAKQLQSGNSNSSIRSADALFVENGVYKFVPERLGYVHHRNRQLVEEDMAAGVELIIVDNTNICHRDYRPYVELAEQYGYEVQFEIIGEFDEAACFIYHVRNEHSVPLWKIQEMAQKFQR
jgi:predicted kinase